MNPFSGLYVFDSATADRSPEENVGDYLSKGGGFGLEVTVGSQFFETDTIDIQVRDDNGPNGDEYIPFALLKEPL